MAINNFITLDGKKYKVMADGWKPVHSRHRNISTGLTGKTIIQDLTPAGREPQDWRYTLRVYVTTPPDTSWGTFSDFLLSFAKTTIPFAEHDDSKTHTVAFNGNVAPQARVPAAAINGDCNEIYYIDASLIKVY